MEPEKANPRLGAHLRAAREASGLTLKALADSMGVTPSLLSQIETEKVQPSLNTLYQLVSRLNLSIDSLLGVGEGLSQETNVTKGDAGSATRPTVQRADDNPSLVLATGVKWERLAGGVEDCVEPLIITFPPRTTSSPEETFSQYNGYEYGLLLEGRLTLRLGFDRHELRAGDSMHFDAFRPHAYINETDEPARGVWFMVRDELLRMRARLGHVAPMPRGGGTLESAWKAVDQTDW